MDRRTSRERKWVEEQVEKKGIEELVERENG